MSSKSQTTVTKVKRRKSHTTKREPNRKSGASQNRGSDGEVSSKKSHPSLAPFNPSNLTITPSKAFNPEEIQSVDHSDRQWSLSQAQRQPSLQLDTQSHSQSQCPTTAPPSTGRNDGEKSSQHKGNKSWFCCCGQRSSLRDEARDLYVCEIIWSCAYLLWAAVIFGVLVYFLLSHDPEYTSDRLLMTLWFLQGVSLAVDFIPAIYARQLWKTGSRGSLNFHLALHIFILIFNFVIICVFLVWTKTKRIVITMDGKSKAGLGAGFVAKKESPANSFVLIVFPAFWIRFIIQICTNRRINGFLMEGMPFDDEIPPPRSCCGP